MKFRSLYEGYDFIYDNDLLHTLLINRGVDKPKEFLTLDDSCIHDGSLFKNMSEALNVYNKHIEGDGKNTSRIHVVVDSDCDGYTSAVEIINYTLDVCEAKGIFCDITYSFHSGKEHGIVLSELDIEDFDLLIVPDAGSGDIEQSKLLKSKGIDVLILDHHNMTRENTYATVVSCQDGSYPNITLSGAGVAYKFCKEYDKSFGYNFANKYLDLLALGVIGDRMDLRNFETRYLSLLGIQQFGENNLFLKEILDKQSYSIGGALNIMKVGWYVAPLINAVVRSGTQEEKEDTFKALLGECDDREYKPRKSKDNQDPQVEIQTLQRYMARECTNIKGRQDREVKKNVELLEQQVIDNKLNESKVLIVNGSEDLDKNFTGLVANKFASTYKKPVIILRNKHIEDEGNGTERPQEPLYGGSGRNCDLSPIQDLQKFLLSLNVFESVEGHDNAFGFSIKHSNLDLLKQKIEESLKETVMEDVYSVDYTIPVGRLKPHHVLEVGQWKDMWGNLLNEPLFAITDIYIPTDKIKLMGAKKNFIKFEIRDIAFTKRFANEDIYNKMICKQAKGLSKKRIDKVRMDIIGKLVINEWEGNFYPQVDIVDFNSVEDNKIMF